MRNDLQQGILLEIALSISGEFQLKKLLENCLPIFLRKLNCTLAGVVRKTEDDLFEELILPRAIIGRSAYLRAMSSLERFSRHTANESFFVNESSNGYDYFVRLEQFGYLVLSRIVPFERYFLLELVALSGMLSRACISCDEVARRHQTEAELVEQINLTDAIIDHAPIGVWLTDHVNLKMLRVNRFFSQHTAILTDNPFITPEELLACRDSDQMAFDADEPFHCLEQVTFADGQKHLLQTIKTKVYRDDGSLVGILGLGVDVTAQRQNELELQRQSRLQQILMEISSTYINLPFDRLEVAIQRSLQDLAIFVEADRAYIFAYDLSAQTASNTHEWCAAGIEPQIARLQNIPMEEFPEWLSSHLQGLPVYVPDVSALRQKGLRNFLEPQGVKSVLAVPMMMQDVCIGAVGFDSVRHHYQYTDVEQRLLKVFAQMLVNVSLRQREDEDRKKAEKALFELNKTLESKVEQRTAELTASRDKIRKALTKVTRSEQAAHRLARQNELFLKSINEGFFGVDSGGLATFVNPAAEKMLGYSSTELIGQPIYSLIHHPHDTGEPYRFDDCTICRVLTTGETLSEANDIFWRKDGSSFPIELQSAPIVEEGKVIGAVVVFADIAERRIMERQLMQAQKLEAVGQLAAGVAHEINTPLQYIQDNFIFLRTAIEDLTPLLQLFHQDREGQTDTPVNILSSEMTELIRQADLPFLLEEVPASIRDSLSGIRQIVNIVSALKEFSHPGGMNKLPVNLNQVVNNAVVISRNEWKFLAELKLDLDPQLPMFLGDQGAWNQILLNLIVNSAHAISDKQLKSKDDNFIRLLTEHADGVIMLTVEDTGVGIDKKIQDRIFEPFFTTKDVGKGTGQGLAIVYDLVVNKHKGTIACHSAPGHGTRFVICVPVAKDAADSVLA